MQILLYNELNPKKIPHFAKLKKYLLNDDFKSADVKKIGHNLYRARLDITNRLLFSIYHFQGERYALILEFIKNHAYDRSRFLQGDAHIDEEKIPVVDQIAPEEGEPLIYLNREHPNFNLLDKVISFDAIQQQIYALQPPMIVIGSAGSGKTALTLEKMKQAVGDVLYITRSPYLVHHSRSGYFSLDYMNDSQEIDFLSFNDYLASIEVPDGREMPFRDFEQWFLRQRLSKSLNDPYQIFEEFKGVLTGADDSAFLSRDDYLGLGIKQSIFLAEERAQIYDLFERYLQVMREEGFYDANILSFSYLKRVEPRYDFIVIDEVQDLTAIQLQVVLKSLRDPHQFILCGDSNQIVHPNFFSWAKIKSLFYRQQGDSGATEIIRILNTNYRNSPEVTEIANRVLKIKNCRFGSVDRESNYLVQSNAHNQGTTILVAEEEKLVRELNQKTCHSTQFAIIVMHPHQKAEVKRHFDTPLIFTIQEAKGLEYENIILYNLISDDEDRFNEIVRGVEAEDLTIDELTYARSKDKGDKSLEIFKFHVNSLYVALTRAIKNIYLIERKPQLRLFQLLQMPLSDKGLDLEAYRSDLEAWRREAHRLKMQGKEEQAEEIQQQILKIKTVDWEILRGDPLDRLAERAFEKGEKRASLQLFEYALVYHHHEYLNRLVMGGFKPAKHPERGMKLLNQKYYSVYMGKQTLGINRLIEKYGVNFRNLFNQTPLMIATRLGHAGAIRELIDVGADNEQINNAGLNPFQISLEQAISDPQYAQKRLAKIYKILLPDGITVQSDGRLYQLGNPSMEFLMFNLMCAMFYLRLGDNMRFDSYFNSEDFVLALEHFPTRVVSEKRKKRSYISSILSKNEVSRDGPYNRRLFLRIKRGHYIPNPALKIRIEGEWRPIFDLLRLDMVSLHYRDYTHEPWYRPEYDWFEMDVESLDKKKARLQGVIDSAGEKG